MWTRLYYMAYFGDLTCLYTLLLFMLLSLFVCVIDIYIYIYIYINIVTKYVINSNNQDVFYAYIHTNTTGMCGIYNFTY